MNDSRFLLSINTKRPFNFFVLYVIFGFIGAVFLSILLKLETNIISVSYRASVLFASGLLITHAILKKQFFVSKWFLPLFLFLVLFTLRSVYSFEVLNFDRYNNQYNPITIYFFMIGSILAPILALALNYKSFDIHYFNKHIHTILILCGSLIIIGIFLRYDGNIFQFIAKRYLLWSQKGEIEGSFSTFNPILISRYGALLVLIFSLPYNLRKFKRTTGILLGVMLLAIGGSRGPILSLALIYLLFLFRHPRKLIVWIIVGVPIGITLFKLLIVTNVEVGLFERFSSEEIGTAGNRIGHWSASLKTIINYPLFGNQIWQDEDYIYPHNLFLEATISTGFFGLLLLLSSLFGFLLKFKSSKINNNYFLINYAFALQLLFTMTSGAVYTNFEF